MEQDLSKVKGFNKLSSAQRDLLFRVHKKHLSSVDDKDRWQIKSVKWEVSYLRVTFINGYWLHYSPNGCWY